MVHSAEGMVFDSESLWVCGRGNDICHLMGSDQAIKLSFAEHK